MNIMDSDQHGQIVCYKKTQVSAGISPQTVPSIIIKIDPDQDSSGYQKASGTFKQ